MQYLAAITTNWLRPSDAYMYRKTNHHWTAPSHYLNHCWNIVKCTFSDKLQWNFNRNSNIFIHENALEYVICKMVSILSRPPCVECDLFYHNASEAAVKGRGEIEGYQTTSKHSKQETFAWCLECTLCGIDNVKPILLLGLWFTVTDSSMSVKHWQHFQLPLI